MVCSSGGYSCALYRRHGSPQSSNGARIDVAGSGRKTGYGNPRPEELTIVNELVAFPAVV
jgi:hypothetical protein